MKTENSREKAMAWWETLKDNLGDVGASGMSKWKLSYLYFNRHWMSLTGREIEEIYFWETKKKETEYFFKTKCIKSTKLKTHWEHW